MPIQKTWSATLAVTLAATLFLALAAPAFGVGAAQQAARDSATLKRATEKLAAARARSAATQRKAQEASERLDEIVAEEDATGTRLNTRAQTMYRNGDTAFLSLLLGAQTFEQFAARWDLLTRMNEEDAHDLERLEVLQRQARSEASKLLQLQEEQVRAVADEAQEVSQARRQLAASNAALAAYEARVAARPSSSPSPAAPKPKKDTTQKLRGTGAWKSALASHYSRTFTGRGASGARIGPYSMMVAHKSLPFGTLIEFEYRGRRAVAKVQDRGPYSGARVFDLGPGVVRTLNFSGVHKVKYRVIGR